MRTVLVGVYRWKGIGSPISDRGSIVRASVGRGVGISIGDRGSIVVASVGLG